MSENALVWCVTQGSDLLLANWEDENIVYHPLSGETHQMDVFSVSVLELLIEGQRTEQQLLNDICQLHSIETRSKIHDLLIQVVNTFDKAGLIQPVYR